MPRIWSISWCSNLIIYGDNREGMIKLRVKGVVVCKPNIVEPSKICTYIKSIQRKLGKKKNRGSTASTGYLWWLNENVGIRNGLYLTKLLAKASQWKLPNNPSCCSDYWVFFKIDSKSLLLKTTSIQFTGHEENTMVLPRYVRTIEKLSRNWKVISALPSKKGQ